MSTIAEILSAEAAALSACASTFSERSNFSEERFISWLKQADQIILVGVGKSGHIARKAAASFASIARRSYFIHASELMHGDLGNISANSLVIVLSYSGKGAEILGALKHISARTNMLLSISAPNSALASACSMNLALECDEAIANLPAPTTSTTLSLAFCDALLAIAARAFDITAADFAYNHPGGSLGKRYYERVKDVVQTARKISASASLREAISAMSQAGYALIVDSDAQDKLLGFLSDGDLRRALESSDFSLDNLAIQYASKSPICVHAEDLAYDAAEFARSKRISTLVVLDDSEQVLGVMRLV